MELKVEEDSPTLGKTTQVNAQSFKRLLDKMGQDSEVDILVLTGDLYDHAVNANPTLTPSNTKAIWDIMDKEAHADNEKYPSFVDALMALSLIHQFMQTYRKPVLFVSGNHEGYHLPYGISPRVDTRMFGTIHGVRANAGIPVDHNLSIYEACLLYGDSYYYYHKDENFTAPILDWAQHLYSPWSDYLLSYGSKQQFIGMGWGDGEDLKGTVAVDMVADGGSLPRANTSISENQKQLFHYALQADGGYNVLLTHFTLVNYGSDIALTNPERLPIDASDVVWLDIFSGDRSNQDQGSFHQERMGVYQAVYENKIQLSLSGHSHRAGAYQLKSAPSSMAGEMKTQGAYPDGYQLSQETGNILVTGSAGPISRQNQKGELYSNAMEPPQGLKIDCNPNGSGKVTIVKDETVRPRIASMMEYIWYEGKKPMFTRPIMGNGRGFTLPFNLDWLIAFIDESDSHAPPMPRRLDYSSSEHDKIQYNRDVVAWREARAKESPAIKAIEHIKLHVIDTTKINSEANDSEHYLGYLELVPNPNSTTLDEYNQLSLKVNGAKLDGKEVSGISGYGVFVDELSRLKSEEKANFFYYISIKISHSFMKDYPNPEQWDLGGWAFPAEFTQDEYGMMFKRFTGEHRGEVPQFNWFKKRTGDTPEDEICLPFYEYLEGKI